MSDFASINGQRIVSGNLRIPMTGLWVADFSLAEQTLMGQQLLINIGNLQLQGHLFRAGSFAGSRSVRCMAGGGGLRKTVPYQGYYSSKGIRLSTILNDICSIVGEKINISNDYIIGNTFVRESKTASVVIRQQIGESWYVDNSGVIQTAARNNSSIITTPFDVDSTNYGQGKFQVATEDLMAWMPYRTFQSVTMTSPQQISETIINIQGNGKLRLQVLTTGPATNG